jgi:hypothetical protein
MAKKVSLPSCWGNGHLSRDKESLISNLLGKLAPFSCKEGFFFILSGKWALSQGKESFFSIQLGKLAPFSWQKIPFSSCG